jgi:hypothetical protein
MNNMARKTVHVPIYRTKSQSKGFETIVIEYTFK